jgi:hypothetical protein
VFSLSESIKDARRWEKEDEVGLWGSMVRSCRILTTNKIPAFLLWYNEWSNHRIEDWMLKQMLVVVAIGSAEEPHEKYSAWVSR